MNDHLIITMTAIIAIVILESVALIKGIDGIALGTTVGAIAAIAGYMFKTHRVLKSGRNDNPKRKG